MMYHSDCARSVSLPTGEWKLCNLKGSESIPVNCESLLNQMIIFQTFERVICSLIFKYTTVTQFQDDFAAMLC